MHTQTQTKRLVFPIRQFRFLFLSWFDGGTPKTEIRREANLMQTYANIGGTKNK